MACLYFDSNMYILAFWLQYVSGRLLPPRALVSNRIVSNWRRDCRMDGVDLIPPQLGQGRWSVALPNLELDRSAI